MESESLKASSPVWPDLTTRERQILYPVIEGKPNKVIACELGISMRTVESHRASLFQKMGVKNAVQLAFTLFSQHGQADLDTNISTQRPGQAAHLTDVDGND
ncbi:MAG: helix-turn-helix transcriptional regulator [Orrella sp.]|jgi:DNA-binding NarL/FixJ family response regulator|uniref:response regulator transcription factor n=1 Tax=Orrella sp. TaxID=1921583 RepID=UPI003BDF1BD9